MRYLFLADFVRTGENIGKCELNGCCKLLRMYDLMDICLEAGAGRKIGKFVTFGFDLPYLDSKGLLKIKEAQKLSRRDIMLIAQRFIH